ncbi:hypothetical protein DIKCMJMK_02102 [Shewanella oneidensis]|nr:hypothetical protein [Shewanella oneidensis]
MWYRIDIHGVKLVTGIFYKLKDILLTDTLS